MTASPAGAPPEVRVGMGRSHIVVTVAVLAFLVLTVSVAGYSGVTADGSARVLGLGFAGMFAVPLVILLIRLPQFLSPAYVILDPHGLRIEQGRARAAVPWHELAAVGFGYALAGPQGMNAQASLDGAVGLVSDYLTDKAAEALRVSDQRQIALEIYPVRPGADTAFPKLRSYWRQLPAPSAGLRLPPAGWRVPLPPVVSVAEAVDAGIATFAPRHRLGWYVRAWRK